jgi:hypothetical protein
MSDYISCAVCGRPMVGSQFQSKFCSTACARGDLDELVKTAALSAPPEATTYFAIAQADPDAPGGRFARKMGELALTAFSPPPLPSASPGQDPRLPDELPIDRSEDGLEFGLDVSGEAGRDGATRHD